MALAAQAGASAAEPTARVVEFYNPSLDHYFVTAFANETATLDAGTIGGWFRTGVEFGAWR
ncbi:MAG: hypothetical protein ABI533_02790, partial [Betaproteobacteria bacterium]